MQGHTTVKKKK